VRCELVPSVSASFERLLLKGGAFLTCIKQRDKPSGIKSVVRHILVYLVTLLTYFVTLTCCETENGGEVTIMNLQLMSTVCD
jgi:hypothetical protein